MEKQSKVLTKRPKTMPSDAPVGVKAPRQDEAARALFPDLKKRSNKNLITKDESGEIVYPIVINNSLRIQNLGQIDWSKPLYHTEKNLFPIGFQSIREHQSLLQPGERCQYLCEILDGGPKPLYKVTPQEGEQQPIMKDSSTGCWIEICKKLNEQNNSKRAIVTVSGPERFGLADLNVIRMLQTLPGADQCSKYIPR